MRDRVQGTKITCQLKTLSDVIREQHIDRIDLLKIDVEKSELDVLAGIEDGDWPRIRQIVIEAHDVNGNLSYLTALLQRQGYSVVTEQDEYLKGSTLYNVFAVRQESAADSTNEPVNHPFIVPDLPETILDPAELRRHVQEKLPDYLWPSAFVVMESLPRLPNGKVDRQALPAPLHLSRSLVSYAVVSPTDRARAIRGALALRTVDRLAPVEAKLAADRR